MGQRRKDDKVKVYKAVREMPDGRLISVAVADGLAQVYRDAKGKLRTVDSSLAFATPEDLFRFMDEAVPLNVDDVRAWEAEAAYARPVGVVLKDAAKGFNAKVFRAFDADAADAPEAITVTFATTKAVPGTVLCKDLKLTKELTR